MSESEKIMQTLRKLLTRRGYVVPALVALEDFFVTGDTTCLVVFANDPSRVGIALIREISKRMLELNSTAAILVSEGPTPIAAVELRKLMNDGKFVVNMTPEFLKFVSVPPHRLMGAAEKKALIARFGAPNLPVICMDDPVVKYYGARPGDVFEITRNRPNVGRHPYFRIVAFNENNKF